MWHRNPQRKVEGLLSLFVDIFFVFFPEGDDWFAVIFYIFV